jgi:hypothetical protein
MSAERLPDALHFDPGSDALPPGLDAVLTDLDRPILLLVAADHDDAAAHAALAIARARAEAGTPTVLAEATAGDPRLHSLLGVDNKEGIADVFLYGASPERVRIRPPGLPFDFIPAGPYMPDDPTVLDSDRWQRLSAVLREAGEGLLLYIPASTPGLEAVSRRVGRSVLLGDPQSVEEIADRLDPQSEVLAVIEPAGTGEAAAAASPEAEPGPARETEEPDAVVEEESGVAAGSEGREVPDGGEPDLVAGVEPVPEEPTVLRGEEKERRSVSPILWILLAAAVAAGAWFLYTEYLATPQAGAAPATTDAEAAVAARGEPVETPVPISVAVEAHQDFEAGMNRVASLRAAEPDLRFYLAPVEVRDALYYRLFAGPVADSAAARRLMTRLVEAGHKTAADPWAIQATPRAFELGEYGSSAAAESRVDSLAELEIPAYVVPIRYEPGPVRYRVYGGAYGTAGDAAAMRRLLSAAGVQAELVTRVGEPSVGGS